MIRHFFAAATPAAPMKPARPHAVAALRSSGDAHEVRVTAHGMRVEPLPCNITDLKRLLFRRPQALCSSWSMLTAYEP